MKDVLIIILGLLAFVEAMLMSVCLTLGYNNGYQDGVKFGKLLKADMTEEEDLEE